MTVEVTRTDTGLRIARLDLFFLELVRQIPVSADPADSAAASDRLYPLASAEPSGAVVNEEWRLYVHPDLKESFMTTAQLVREDLEVCEKMDETGELWTIEIPEDHFDQWLNVLNQARLSLSARFDFQEDEMNDMGPKTIETVRELSLFQVHFYGFLQECLLQDLED